MVRLREALPVMEPVITPVVKWAQKMYAYIAKGPPKLYNPQIYSAADWTKRAQEVMSEPGEDFGTLYNKLRLESVLRKGTLVGTDKNGNKYYENRSAPYGRHRWVEYPHVRGWWGVELKQDGSMVSPEWHGWLHYMHDKTGKELQAEFEKPFVQEHKINQSMLRPEFSRQWFGELDPPQPPEFHQPPGQHKARVVRGRVGPKYEAWSGSPVQTANPEQRNFGARATPHAPRASPAHTEPVSTPERENT